jgi:fructose-1,6-bisphosphatase
MEEEFVMGFGQLAGAPILFVTMKNTLLDDFFEPAFQVFVICQKNINIYRETARRFEQQNQRRSTFENKIQATVTEIFQQGQGHNHFFNQDWVFAEGRLADSHDPFLAV